MASSEKALLQAKEEEISKLREQISTLTSSRQQEAIQEEPDAPEAQQKVSGCVHQERAYLLTNRNSCMMNLNCLKSAAIGSSNNSEYSTVKFYPRIPIRHLLRLRALVNSCDGA